MKHHGAQASLVLLFVFQLVSWNFDTPISNRGKLLAIYGRNVFSVFSFLNAWPHLFGALAFRWEWRSSALTYVALLTFWCVAQIATWWIPYLFGVGGFFLSSLSALRLYTVLYDANIRLLPRIGDHTIVPDLEHTILLILALYALSHSCTSLLEMFDLPSSNSHRRLHSPNKTLEPSAMKAHLASPVRRRTLAQSRSVSTPYIPRATLRNTPPVTSADGL